MAKDPQATAEKAFSQTLDLLEELSTLFVEGEDDDEKEDDAEEFDIQDVIDMAVEEAAERGLDEEAAERLFKAMAHFAEKNAER